MVTRLRDGALLLLDNYLVDVVCDLHTQPAEGELALGDVGLLVSDLQPAEGELALGDFGKLESDLQPAEGELALEDEIGEVDANEVDVLGKTGLVGTTSDISAYSGSLQNKNGFVQGVLAHVLLRLSSLQEN